MAKSTRMMPFFQYDAQKKEEPDEGVEGERFAEDEEGYESAERCGGKGRHDGEGVEEIFIEDPEDDVDQEKCEEEEEVEVGEGFLKDVSGSLHFSDDVGGEGGAGGPVDALDGGSEGDIIDVKEDVHGRQAVDAVDFERAGQLFHGSYRVEGNQSSRGGAEVELGEPGGVLVILGFDLEDGVVLVGGGVDGGEVGGAVGEGEGVLDIAGGEVEDGGLSQSILM